MHCSKQCTATVLAVYCCAAASIAAAVAVAVSSDEQALVCLSNKYIRREETITMTLENANNRFFL